MLVKDEADIVSFVLDHLHAQVDAVYVYDNLSTDGTREILEDRGETWFDDREVGYFQSKKTTRAARHANDLGHSWVLPCDADEIWYSPDGRTVSDYLSGIAPGVRVVTGALFNHIPSGLDDATQVNPVKRIGWRQQSHGALPKVCVHMGPDVTIAMGNHGASYSGYGLTVPGLALRHFTWRTPEQYLRKIRNGMAAYAATDMGDQFGAHWRMFNGASDEAIMDHFRQWFFFDDPAAEDLVYDPAPSSEGLPTLGADISKGEQA
jgi:hypothetical protein